MEKVYAYGQKINKNKNKGHQKHIENVANRKRDFHLFLALDTLRQIAKLFPVRFQPRTGDLACSKAVKTLDLINND